MKESSPSMTLQQMTWRPDSPTYFFEKTWMAPETKVALHYQGGPCFGNTYTKTGKTGGMTQSGRAPPSQAWSPKFKQQYCGKKKSLHLTYYTKVKTISEARCWWLMPVIPATQAGGIDQENRSWTLANSSRDPISRKPIIKKGWQSGLRCRPWVQTPVLQKTKQKTKKGCTRNILLIKERSTQSVTDSTLHVDKTASLGLPNNWRQH
jgi:hypothetical protein